MTTRMRKKGCPFCKSSPERCCLSVDQMSRFARVICLACGAAGPEESLLPTAPADLVTAVWIKWNKRG